MQKPHGSVFAVTSVSDGELLQPLALECLAHPSGIALSPSEDAIYVSETLNNRILRFVQKPAGVYHCSEFYKFSGRFGPTALAIDGDGNIYAAHFDFKGWDAFWTCITWCSNFLNVEYNADTEGRGQIAVISPQGELVKRIFVPGPEITGLAFDRFVRRLIPTLSANIRPQLTSLSVSQPKRILVHHRGIIKISLQSSCRAIIPQFLRQRGIYISNAQYRHSLSRCIADFVSFNLGL